MAKRLIAITLFLFSVVGSHACFASQNLSIQKLKVLSNPNQCEVDVIQNNSRSNTQKFIKSYTSNSPCSLTKVHITPFNGVGDEVFKLTILDEGRVPINSNIFKTEDGNFYCGSYMEYVEKYRNATVVMQEGVGPIKTRVYLKNILHVDGDRCLVRIQKDIPGLRMVELLNEFVTEKHCGRQQFTFVPKNDTSFSKIKHVETLHVGRHGYGSTYYYILN